MDEFQVLIISHLLRVKERCSPHATEWLTSVVMAILLTACGGNPAPTPTVEPTAVPLMPTLAPTASPTMQPSPTANAAPQSPLSLLPTVAITTTAVMTTGVPTNTATDAITTTVTLTAATVHSGSVGSTTATTETVGTDEGSCPVEVDIALVAYPELHQLGCPEAEAGFEPVAMNEFGQGPAYDRFMLWFSTTNEIYVMLPSGDWESYPDTWTEDQPTFVCNPLEGEPSSPPLPRRGFGKLWCSMERLQSTLGMVEREERLCQHTVTQQFTNGRLLACYEDATIRFFRIMDDGTWAQILTQ